MKVQRTSAYTSRRNRPRSRTVTMQAVRNLLRAVFNPTTPEPGTAPDFSDLTDAKLLWRRNAFTESEFRNGLNDSPASAGNRTPTTLAGFAGAIQIGFDGTTLTYLYKTNPFTPEVSYTFSAFVEMDDDLGPPVVGGASSPTGDLAINAGGIATTNVSVSAVSGRRYRISRASSGGTSIGIVKYANNTARTFKITGYQIERGALSAYQGLTDVGTEFLREFPYHSLFQDNLGQSPVWTVEQPIGLVLDMRFGGLRGPQMVTNPATAGLPAGGGVRYYSQSLNMAPLAANKFYEISYTVSDYSGTGNVGLAGSAPAGFPQTNHGANGNYRTLVSVTGAGALSFYTLNTNAANFSNLSVREVYGNHAIQPTLGDRPISDARTNRLTNTEKLSDTSWVKSQSGTGVAPVVTDNYGAAPDGTMTATRLQMSTGGGTTTSDISRIYYPVPSTIGAFYPEATWIRTTDGSTKTITYRDDVAITKNANIVVTGTWQRFQVLHTAAVGTQVNAVGLWVRGGVGTDLAADLLVWHPQVERSNSAAPAGPYQRVGAVATDYDAVGFPKGARFNGVNSWMRVDGMSFAGSDKAMLFASVRKDSDAAYGTIFEYGIGGTDPLAFSLTGPRAAGVAAYGADMRDGTNTAAIAPAGFAAPHTAVLVAGMDYAGGSAAADLTFQVNGVTYAGTGSNTTAAAHGNYTAYIGRRGGTTLPFLGVMYRVGGRSTGFENVMAMAARYANEPVKVLS